MKENDQTFENENTSQVEIDKNLKPSHIDLETSKVHINPPKDFFHVPEVDRSSSHVEVCVILGVLLAVLILCVSSWAFFSYNQMENEVVSALIPQPFTENNDFMFFHLKNKLKVMLIKPTQEVNQTYIGFLISSYSRSWIKHRPF